MPLQEREAIEKMEETKMSVQKVGIGHWYSSLTETAYDSEKAARHYDNLERQRMQASGETYGTKLLNSISTGELKSLVSAAIVEADSIAGNRNFLEVQQDFVNANPDYVANRTNGIALSAVLVERGLLDPNGTYLGTMEDMQNTYIDLAQKGVLQMREGTKLPQRVDEAEAYSLPMDELERRSRGW
jgi:hypothetical protein